MRTVGGRAFIGGDAPLRPVAKKNRKFELCIISISIVHLQKKNLHVPRPRFLSGGDLDLCLSLL